MFVFRLTQGHFQFEWLMPVFLSNLLFSHYKTSDKVKEVELLELKVLKKSQKYFKTPVLARSYMQHKGLTKNQLDEMISLGDIDAYEEGDILVIDDRSEK